MAGDFDQDGFQDLCVLNSLVGEVFCMRYAGNATFESSVPFPAGDRPVALTSGDFNGDGIPDLAAVNSQSELYIWLNDPDGELSGPRVRQPFNISTIDSDMEHLLPQIPYIRFGDARDAMEKTIFDFQDQEIWLPKPGLPNGVIYQEGKKKKKIRRKRQNVALPLEKNADEALAIKVNPSFLGGKLPPEIADRTRLRGKKSDETCSKSSCIERYARSEGQAVSGNNDEVYDGVSPSVEDCAFRCAHSEIECISFDFHLGTKTCILSKSKAPIVTAKGWQLFVLDASAEQSTMNNVEKLSSLDDYISVQRDIKQTDSDDYYYYYYDEQIESDREGLFHGNSENGYVDWYKDGHSPPVGDSHQTVTSMLDSLPDHQSRHHNSSNQRQKKDAEIGNLNHNNRVDEQPAIFVGWALAQLLDTEEQAQQDKRLDGMCAQTFSGTYAAYARQILRRSIQNMPSENDSDMFVVPKCLDRECQPSANINPRARLCVTPDPDKLMTQEQTSTPLVSEPIQQHFDVLRGSNSNGAPTSLPSTAFVLPSFKPSQSRETSHFSSSTNYDVHSNSGRSPLQETWSPQSTINQLKTTNTVENVAPVSAVGPQHLRFSPSHGHGSSPTYSSEDPQQMFPDVPIYSSSVYEISSAPSGRAHSQNPPPGRSHSRTSPRWSQVGLRPFQYHPPYPRNGYYDPGNDPYHDPYANIYSDPYQYYYPQRGGMAVKITSSQAETAEEKLNDQGYPAPERTTRVDETFTSRRQSHSSYVAGQWPRSWEEFFDQCGSSRMFANVARSQAVAVMCVMPPPSFDFENLTSLAPSSCNQCETSYSPVCVNGELLLNECHARCRGFESFSLGDCARTKPKTRHTSESWMPPPELQDGALIAADRQIEATAISESKPSSSGSTPTFSPLSPETSEPATPITTTTMTPNSSKHDILAKGSPSIDWYIP